MLAVAERIRRAISQLPSPSTSPRRPHHRGLSVSIGVAVYPTAGTVVDRLLHAADTALYRAKNTGRNKVVSF